MTQEITLPVTEDVDTNRITKPKLGPESVSMDERISSIDNKQAQQTIAMAQSVGTPLFTIDDLNNTRNVLALLVRYLILRDHITKEKFEERHGDMAKQTNMHINKQTYDRHNTYKSLMLPRITWDFVEKFFQIIGYDILDVTLTVYDRYKSEVSTISKSDVIKMIEKPRESVSIMENEAAQEQFLKNRTSFRDDSIE